MQNVLFETIKQLPPLPASIVKIEAIYHDPDSSFQEMAKVLETDPLLTADILKAANSPLYGFSREMTSIPQVVSLFGMGTIRGFALASMVSKSFELNLSPYGISNEQFSSLATTQHALITRWYQKTEPKLLELLSPATFLVETGKVLLAQCLIKEEKTEAFRAEANECSDLEALERSYCDADTPEVSAAIFDHWRFENELINIIKYSCAPENAPEAVKKAAQSLQAVRVAVPVDGVITDKSIDAAKELINRYGLDEASFESALNNIKEQLPS